MKNDDLVRDIIRHNYAYYYLNDKEETILKEVFGYATCFFELSAEQKKHFALPNVISGFREMGIEYSADPGRPDLNESFSYRPQDWSSFEMPDVLSQPFLHSLALLHKLLDDVVNKILTSLASYYNKANKVPRTNMFSWIQINYYQPNQFTRDTLQDEHEDGHIITLAVSNKSGLQIKPDDSYQTVEPASDKLLIMPGELLSILTGYEVPPLFHRVVSFPNVDKRLSLMYFVNPDPDEKKIEPWVKNEKNKDLDIAALGATNPNKYGLPGL